MIKLAPIFKNGMILQRNSKVRIWGESDCDRISIAFCAEEYNAEVIQSKWTIDITTGECPVVSATDSCRNERQADDGDGSLIMTISGIAGDSLTETITISDILLGDVWFAGGQSNMELELQNSEKGAQVMSASDFDKIRFYNVPKFTIDGEELRQAEENSRWKSAVGTECADMSAVAYYFAVKLYEELKIPIGIIDCYVGGTSATCWVEREMLDDIPEVREYIKEWDDSINNKSPLDFDREMEEYNVINAKWGTCVDRLRRENPDIEWGEIVKIAGECPWPPPKGYKSMQRPFGLYECMVSHVAPYGISGFIYYQAEEDVDRASYYHLLNSAVIRQWRKSFGVNVDGDELPFYLTQLPMFISVGEADDRRWGELRLNQAMAAGENVNANYVVIADCGELNNIHPIDKCTPGTRLALLALDSHYRLTKGCKNLQLKNVTFEDNICTLTFENTCGDLLFGESDGENLTSKSPKISIPDGPVEDGKIYGFEISSNGSDFYSPVITKKGDSLILEGKTAISYVQYAYFNYGVANVYSKAGMPLAPCRMSSV